MKEHLTLEQRIFNAYGSQECERLHGIHQLLSESGRLREEFPFMWARTDEISWGYNWGRCIGWQDVLFAQFGNLGQLSMQYDVTIPKLYPETGMAEAGTSGFQEYNELNSGVIEVADDGKSCRASWVCHGMQYTHFKPNGTRFGANTMERYGADFVYDESDGHWKFLHEQVASDGSCLPFDVGNWAYDSYMTLAKKMPDGVPVPEEEAGVGSAPPCSAPGSTHSVYNALQPTQKAVDAPVPYQTMDENNTYTSFELKPDPDLFRYEEETGRWMVNR